MTRLRRILLGALVLGFAPVAFAINTATISGSALSLDCLEYRIVGICYWLSCSLTGCHIDVSVEVSHYNPDAVVSSYMVTGHNPWTDVAFMSPPNPTALNGGDGTTNQPHENNLAKFRNADVVGHPATLLADFVSRLGWSCKAAGRPLQPYLLSTLDTVAWRYNIPEMFYPESLIPGRREIGTRLALNLWGNVYPRGGFLHQVDDYKASAVVAQRAGDIVTRRGQPHVYRPLLATELPVIGDLDGYWPAEELIESDATTGKWQELVPTLRSTCAVFPNNDLHVQATDGGYVWALWRPYRCCERKGQVLLAHVEFDP